MIDINHNKDECMETTLTLEEIKRMSCEDMRKHREEINLFFKYNRDLVKQVTKCEPYHAPKKVSLQLARMERVENNEQTDFDLEAIRINQKSYLNKAEPWKKTLHYIQQKCENPLNFGYKNIGGKGIDCLLTAEELKIIWYRDQAFKMKKPVLKRTNVSGHFEATNCYYEESEK